VGEGVVGTNGFFTQNKLGTSVEQLNLIIKELQRNLEHGGFLSGFLGFFVEQLGLKINELERNLELRRVYKGSQRVWNN
jgi:hypothetical protein